MELIDFLRETQLRVRADIGERMNDSGSAYPYPESVFAEIVMQHMADIGMTFEDTEVCHFERIVKNAKLRLSGYALSEEADQLDLFVSLYSGVDNLTPITGAEIKNAADQCYRFLKQCIEGRLVNNLDESDDAYTFVLTIQESHSNLNQIRIFVLTDRCLQGKTKRFKDQQVGKNSIKLEVMDIERLYRHWSEGKPRDEIIVDFNEICGGPLPCVYVRGEAAEYDYALTAFPGEALRFIYDKYSARLLEANVRSFLSVAGKVNRGIRDTLKSDPERFMAYNNGIVVVADSAVLGPTADGGPGLIGLTGMQIVNGGQTTASIYFTKKKNPDIDLHRVRIAAKIIVMHSVDSTSEEILISDISRYANSQNSVKQSDLSANKPFHVELERLSTTIYLPDGVGRWFYERAAGSYNVMINREGSTPARLRQLREAIPTSRKITKTDLAKFFNVWAQKPDLVSQGAQKNFDKFMADLTVKEGEPPLPLPTPAVYKQLIAKAILYKKAHTVVSSMCRAFYSHITNYLVSVLSNRLGDRMDFEKIWEKQDISVELRKQLLTWAFEVSEVLHSTADGRMISEWAKKAECWEAVRNAKYSDVIEGIPEIRQRDKFN